MTDFADKLRSETIGIRLERTYLGTRKTMAKADVERVASLFGAEHDSVGGSRAVLNRKHELLKPVFQMMNDTPNFLAANTIDYPERGVRLIKLSRVDWMQEQIVARSATLCEHLEALDAGWDTVVAEARERLGDLFNPADYHVTPSRMFSISLSFPAIKPDDRLLQLHPELYAAEQARIKARFDEAIKNAEAAATEELGELLKHFIERLSHSEDGKRKVMRDSVVDSITEFAERFKSLSIGSNSDLDALVAEVQDLASGIDVKAVRKADQTSRQQLSAKLAGTLSKLDSLIMVRPARSIDLD